MAIATDAGGRLVPARRTVDVAPLGAEHQRPARQGPAHPRQGHHRRRPTSTRPTSAPDGAYTIPAGNLFPLVARRAAGQDAARDLRDGLPQPVPHPGRRERRRLRHRLLAGLADAARSPRPGRRRPRRDRPPPVQLRLADLLLARPRRTTAGTSTSSRRARRRSARRWTTRAADRLRQPDGPHNDSRWNARRRPGRRARPAPTCRRSPIRTSGTRTATTTPRRRSARRASATTRRRRADRAGLDDRVPAAVPGALHRRRRPARRGEVPLRPGQPEPDEVPAVLRQLDHPRRVHARTRCARSSSTRRTASSRSTASWTAAQANIADSPFDVRVRQPDGHAVRRRRRVLPADLRRRLLRHQPGRRHVPVGVRQGPARAEGRAQRRQDRRRRAADGQLLERGLAATTIRATRSASSGTSATARRSRPSPTRRTSTPRPAATPPC